MPTAALRQITAKQDNQALRARLEAEAARVQISYKASVIDFMVMEGIQDFSKLDYATRKSFEAYLEGQSGMKHIRHHLLAFDKLKQHASLLFSVLSPVLQILAALGIGLALGAAHTLLIRFLPARHNRLVLTIAFVLTATAVAELLGLSALLTTMAMGAVFANFCKQSAQVMELTDRFTNPIYMMFFVLSGAGLNLSILPSIGLVGVIYVVVRVLGKMAGAWFGATLMHGPAEVRRYLGPALLPQAGVAIGLTVVAQQVVPQYAEVIRAVILCGTLIYELIGPGVAKWALQKAGEIEKGA